MALLEIVRMGSPVLHRPARPVKEADNPEIRQLVADMIETMVDAGGVGLAAPQVDRDVRVIVYHVPKTRAETPEDILPVQVLINPELAPLGDEIVTCTEGCLSVPGLRGDVPRYARVRYRGQDLSGRVVEGEARGFHANVLQHEHDHLEGILYPQRIVDFTRFGFVEELLC